MGLRRRGGEPAGEHRGLPTGRSPTARTRRPRLLSAGSRMSRSPHAKRHWGGPPSSPSPAAAHRRSGRRWSTRLSIEGDSPGQRASLACGCCKLLPPQICRSAPISRPSPTLKGQGMRQGQRRRFRDRLACGPPTCAVGFRRSRRGGTARGAGDPVVLTRRSAI